MDSQSTQYLTVDLEITSRTDLAPMVAALGRKVNVHFCGRVNRKYLACLDSNLSKSADATIRRFCKLIHALPKAERVLWDTATFRDFNIGIQAGVAPYSYELALSPDTVKAASELGARIAVTVYAADPVRSQTMQENKSLSLQQD